MLALTVINGQYDRGSAPVAGRGHRTGVANCLSCRSCVAESRRSVCSLTTNPCGRALRDPALVRGADTATTRPATMEPPHEPGEFVMRLADKFGFFDPEQPYTVSFGELPDLGIKRELTELHHVEPPTRYRQP